MTGLTTDETGRIEADFSFPESFLGFQGHFPENPVLPGLCIVQAAVVLLESQCGGDVRLDEIAVAKFFTVVVPDMKVRFQCTRMTEDEKSGVLKVKADSAGDRIAQLKLKYSLISAGAE